MDYCVCWPEVWRYWKGHGKKSKKKVILEKERQTSKEFIQFLSKGNREAEEGKETEVKRKMKEKYNVRKSDKKEDIKNDFVQ